MNATVERKKRHRLCLAEQAWQPQARLEPASMVFTGLTVTVAGHLLKLERDEALKVAVVVSQPLLDYVPNGTEAEAIRFAADRLCQRAKRVLGDGWQVTIGESNGAG